MSNNFGKQALKYATLPGFIPRIAALLSSSFSVSAYSVACIFYSVRLFPASHPYVNPANIGTFGLRHVLGAAAEHLDFKWRNIDQVIIYFMILAGVIILLSQFALMVLGVITHQPAVAQLFTRVAEDHHQDLVMVVMDRVFGVPGIFNSCVSVAAEQCTDLYGNVTLDIGDQFPFAFHLAFHQMLSFYSNGIFIVACMVIVYFVVVVVSETAASGSPFGQRYNKTWIPMRIILFLALLVPLNSDNGVRNGLNAAQLITLFVARTGSDFASNGWDLFHENLSDEYKVGQDKLIATTKLPGFDQVMGFVLTARACKAAEELKIRREGFAIDPYLIRGGVVPFEVAAETFGEDTGEEVILLTESDFLTAVQHSKLSSVEIVFGPHIPNKEESFNTKQIEYYETASEHVNNVWPICGRLSLSISDTGSSVSVNEDGEQVFNESPAYKIQELYYTLIKELWDDSEIIQVAMCLAAQHATELQEQSQTDECRAAVKEVDSKLKSSLKTVQDSYEVQYKEIIQNKLESGEGWDLTQPLSKKGWAGAALWYNQIADLNGKISMAVQNLPEIVKFPDVMEYVLSQKQATDENIAVDQLFNPLISAREYVNFAGREEDQQTAIILYRAHSIFNGTVDYQSEYGTSSNFLELAIDAIFGAKGLYDIRDNPGVNPLAQLSTLGKSVMDAAIRNIAGGFIVEKLAGPTQKMTQRDKAMSTLGGAIQTIGYVCIITGFSLYYVLPMMPFIYFFFAFSGWVKSIFEAIVAMPLWAMSHITRWDGEGIAGPAANNGYMLLLEIFLRPIMILFGLLASISIFSASVFVLNDIFNLLVTNVGGAAEGLVSDDPGFSMSEVRSGIDELFYTVIYAVLVYMVGQSCFKLIDQIPNQILRWMSFSTQTFQEANKNAAEELAGKADRGMKLSTAKLTNMTASEKLAI